MKSSHRILFCCAVSVLCLLLLRINAQDFAGEETGIEESTGAIYGDHDFNFTLSMTGGPSKPGIKSYDSWAPGFFFSYVGLSPVTDNFTLRYRALFDGFSPVLSGTPAPQLNHPLNLIPAIGAEYYGFGVLEADFFWHILPKSGRIDFPLFHYANDSLHPVSPHIKAQMVQRYKTGADIYWDYPVTEKLNTTVNILYTNLSYDYYRLNDFESNLRDADVWFHSTGTHALVDNQALGLQANILAKNDLNKYSGYNFFYITTGGVGNYRLLFKKLNGTASLLLRYYSSPIMKDKNYATDLGFTTSLRFYLEMLFRLYLKGDIRIDAAPLPAPRYAKQHYEFSLRKAWLEGSSVETGIWTSAGGLTPRTCAFAQLCIKPNEKWEFAPAVKGYLLVKKNEKILTDTLNNIIGRTIEYKNEHYRTDGEFVVKYQLLSKSEKHIFLKHLTIKSGLQVRMQTNALPPGINTVDFFVGLANYL